MFEFEEYYKLLNGPAQSLYLEQVEVIKGMLPAAGESEKTEKSEKNSKKKKHKGGSVQRYLADEASWLCKAIAYEKKTTEAYYAHESLKEMQKDQDILFASMEKDYRNSNTNPVHMTKIFGPELGPVLSILSGILRTNIRFAHCHMRFAMAARHALFIDAAGILSSERPDAAELLTLIRNYEGAFSQVREPLFLYDHYLSDYSHFEDVIRKGDLSDKGYLYRFPIHITANEFEISRFMDSLTDEEINRMASSLVEGYRTSFFADGKDYLSKKTVGIYHRVGMERLTRKVMELFESRMRFVPFISRLSGTSMDQQFQLDHKMDFAFLMDEDFKTQSLEALKNAMEDNKERLAVYGGPAVLLSFGEEKPKVRSNRAIVPSEEQTAMYSDYMNQRVELIQTYMRPSETSFTMEAWPVPQIGKDFEAIFRKMIEINTLDNEAYRKVQQVIIDELDTGSSVEIEGRDGNETNLSIALAPLRNPKKETLFYNCVADCNIPLGEVFTSPKLAGTNGVLHLESFFDGRITYKNLKLTFTEGYVTDYSCSNFMQEEENKQFVKDNLLYPHDTLPMGEFAIGTNTLAYAMAVQYQIVEKLPILVVEKMGPHIAIGDTCYTGTEEIPVYNPINSKEVMARENEKTALRHTDRSQAYTQHHTDLTIPYDRLGTIRVRMASGMFSNILKDGRFVLKGTEFLNQPLAELETPVTEAKVTEEKAIGEKNPEVILTEKTVVEERVVVKADSVVEMTEAITEIKTETVIDIRENE